MASRCADDLGPVWCPEIEVREVESMNYRTANEELELLICFFLATLDKMVSLVEIL